LGEEQWAAGICDVDLYTRAARRNELDRSLGDLHNQQLVASAYAEFYDERGGSIEIEFKEDKQGFGLAKRNKKRAAAQQMVMFLNSLAHNVLVWVQKWLAEQVPKLASFGTLRLVRDVLSVSGKVEFDSKASKLKRIVLNRAAPIISKLLTAFRSLLLAEQVSIILGEI
jgi:hypothetical protein